MLSDRCKNRLENWKFQSAHWCASTSEASESEQAVVEALASAFGNSGWFGGALGVIVEAAVDKLVSSGWRDAEEVSARWMRHLDDGELRAGYELALREGASPGAMRVVEALLALYGDSVYFSDSSMGLVAGAAIARLAEDWPDTKEGNV